MAERRYVSTTRDGRSRTADGEVVLEVPPAATPPATPAGAGLSGAPTPGEGPAVELRSLEGLLDDLGERIFVAEAGGAGPGDEAGAVVRVSGARLVGETRWDDARAARFALECTEHALEGSPDVALPHGRTLGGVLADVRTALDRVERPSAALGWLGRFAALRRLRRDGAAVGDLAMLAAKEDEGAGIDLVDDPAWTRLAAAEEAVLACAEAVQYLAHPRWLSTREEREERAEVDAAPAEPRVEETPWGWVAIGSTRVPAHRSAARSAEQAAERCRQAAVDAGGAEAGAAERAFQVALLARLLGEGPAGET